MAHVMRDTGETLQVRLEYYNRASKKWLRESAKTLRGSGQRALNVDPICRGGEWCDSRFRYRLVLPGSYVPLAIRFVAR